MNSPTFTRNQKRPRQSRRRSRPFDFCLRHYELLKAGILSNTSLTQAQFDEAMRDARRIAGV